MEESDADMNQEALNEFKESLKTQRFDPAPIAQHLCQVKGVSDVRYIVPFGKRTYTWELMRESHLKIEVGSVSKNGSQPGVYQTKISTRTLEAAEQQVTRCLFDPSSDSCRFLDNPDPRKPFVHPLHQKPMKHDLNKVCIYGVAVRHQLSSVPIRVAARLNWVHSGLDKAEDLSDHYKLYADAGGIPGAFMSVAATRKEGEDVQRIPIHALGYGYSNKEFVRSMALVTEANLWNGIVKIPKDVCLAARLPVFQGFPGPSADQLADYMEQLSVSQKEIEERRHKQQHDEEEEEEEDMGGAMDIDMESRKLEFIESTRKRQEEDYKDADFINFYYALPINHVLAWGLRDEEYARQHGFRAEQFRFLNPETNKPTVLYFLVGDAYMDKMVEIFREQWMNKVDVRPLKSCGVELVPQLDGHYPEIEPDKDAVRGILRLRVRLDYMTAPGGLTTKTIAELAPALGPAFPACDEWGLDQQTRNMMAEAYMAHEAEQAANKQRGATTK